MLAIVFAIVVSTILIVAFNSNQGPPDAPSSQPQSAEAIAAAAAKRHPRPSVAWEPRLRSSASDGWRMRELDSNNGGLSAEAWAHAKHYND